MMSVVSATSGTCSRICATRSRKRSFVYGRFIALRTRVEPDWSGRWMCSHSDGSSACARITSSRMYVGCGLV